MVSPEIMNRVEKIIERFNDTYILNAKRVLRTDDYTQSEHIKSLIFSLYALHILEAGLFQTSFITTFAFGENKVMESSAKTMGKISKDEINHKALTQYLISKHRKIPEWKSIMETYKQEIIEMYKLAYEADLMWIDYLFEDGARLLGLNAEILKEFSRYNTYQAMKAVGLTPFLDKIEMNPCSWATKYTNTSKTQTALNETDGSNYLLGVLNKSILEEDYKELDF